MLAQREKLAGRSRSYKFLLILASMVLLSVGAAAQDARSVRVGVTSNPPISFHSVSGPPSGLAVDVINEVAGRENWRVIYVQETWPNLIKKMDAGELDIIAGVGYSEKRTHQFNFTSEALVSNWGVIYRRPDVSISSVADLEGKRIALPRKGIHSVAIRDLLSDFSIEFSPVLAENFDDALNLVEKGAADAAVVARLFGIMRAQNYDVASTAINFNPVEVRLVTPLGEGADLRAAIDRYLSVEKKVPGSSYHVSLSHWLKTSAGKKIPLWLVWSSSGAFVGLLVSLFIIWLLGHRVAARNAALVESEERFRATFEQAAVGIAHVGLDGRWLRVNQRLCDILGYTAEELKALNFQDITPPETHEADTGMMEPLIRGETDIYVTEKSYVRKDESLVPVNLTVAVARASDGKALYFISVVEDITERRQAEEQFRQAQKMETVGQLTAGVAHDFNNMLAIIWGNAELLGDDLGKDNPRLAKVLRATKRGSDLTQRLLAFSRKQVLNPETINVNNLIANITVLLSRSLEEDIEIGTIAGAGLWNCEVDPAQLENALVNLALNARDAMPDGGKLTIETANVRLDDEYAATQAEVTPGRYIMLAVTDTGTGMPPEVCKQVFEPFFTTKEVGAGSGLGLSMVYGFVKQTGGHVTIYSEPGEGTTVKIYLPRSSETMAATRKPVTDEVPAAGGETVLVVEDDPEVRDLAVELLESLGYLTMEAATGAAALKQLESETEVDLLLTDVVLPGGMNGRELATEVVRRNPVIKVLFMSGYTEDSIAHHGRLDPDATMLQKPFRRIDLARAVRSVLALH